MKAKNKTKLQAERCNCLSKSIICFRLNNNVILIPKKHSYSFVINQTVLDSNNKEYQYNYILEKESINGNYFAFSNIK